MHVLAYPLPDPPTDEKIFLSRISGDPVTHARYANLLADIAFFNVYPNPSPYYGAPFSTLTGRGVSRPLGNNVFKPSFSMVSASYASADNGGITGIVF